MAGDGRGGHAYDEKAFRHLLALERVRSGRSGLPVVVLLVEVRPRPDPIRRLAPAWAARLFSALSACLRETDIIGWYRRARVAGVVLTELGEAPAADVSRRLMARIARALDEELPANVAYHVTIRLYRRPRPTGSMRATADLRSGGD